ncbi:hypothetical protein [Flexibacterium corallicola]|nr:hypothetical protein [Pseudovibrio sp. M1P-2-3]
MSDQNKDQQKTAGEKSKVKETREDRLAQALRANLRRRKQAVKKSQSPSE